MTDEDKPKPSEQTNAAHYDKDGTDRPPGSGKLRPEGAKDDAELTRRNQVNYSNGGTPTGSGQQQQASGADTSGDVANPDSGVAPVGDGDPGRWTATHSDQPGGYGRQHFAPEDHVGAAGSSDRAESSETSAARAETADAELAGHARWSARHSDQPGGYGRQHFGADDQAGKGAATPYDESLGSTADGGSGQGGSANDEAGSSGVAAVRQGRDGEGENAAAVSPAGPSVTTMPSTGAPKPGGAAQPAPEGGKTGMP